MENLIGRKRELDELKRLYISKKSEFVAVYGRRRVGKTFLIDEALRGKITFRHAGLSPIDESGQSNNLKQQLLHFYQSLQLHGMRKSHCPKSWLEAFFMLEQSAFCNAGFDILGRPGNLYPSLTAYIADPLINTIVVLLIVTGGIGFLTWDDVCTHRLHLRRYRMQSKVILAATGLLILLPAVLFFFTDFSDLPMEQRFLASLFQAVTPRTAGYNTADLTAMTEASRAVMILLMLIGGAPGSTAGGMKVTTLTVLAANAFATFRRRAEPQLFHRRLEGAAIRNASTILLLYLTLFFTGAVIISTAEGLPLSACLYETASAVGTVGLTLGLTPQLGALSQWILIVLMFLGRVGGLTLIYAAYSGRDLSCARFPQEKITVG